MLPGLFSVSLCFRGTRTILLIESLTLQASFIVLLLLLLLLPASLQFHRRVLVQQQPLRNRQPYYSMRRHEQGLVLYCGSGSVWTEYCINSTFCSTDETGSTMQPLLLLLLLAPFTDLGLLGVVMAEQNEWTTASIPDP